MSKVTVKGQATRAAIIALRKENPYMKATVMADVIGVSRERVRQLLIVLDLPTSFFAVVKECEQCKEPLPNTLPRSKYCSRKCYSDSRHSMYVCDDCGKLFRRRTKLVNILEDRGYRYKFCDRRCLGSYAGTHWGWGKSKGNRYASKLRLKLYKFAMKIEEVVRK